MISKQAGISNGFLTNRDIKWFPNKQGYQMVAKQTGISNGFQTGLQIVSRQT